MKSVNIGSKIYNGNNGLTAIVKDITIHNGQIMLLLEDENGNQLGGQVSNQKLEVIEQTGRYILFGAEHYDGGIGTTCEIARFPSIDSANKYIEKTILSDNLDYVYFTYELVDSYGFKSVFYRSRSNTKLSECDLSNDYEWTVIRNDLPKTI